MADIVVQFKGTVYENGYGQIAQRVMRDKSLHAVAKAIYAYLVSFAGQSGVAFPGVELMMEELGIKSKDTYYKYRHQLEDAGYITIEEKQPREKGQFGNNVYNIETVPCPKKSYTVKSYTKKSYTKKLDINNNSLSQKTSLNKKQKDNNTDLVVAIESHLGKSIKTLKPLLGKWIDEYGKGYLLEKAQYIGSKEGDIKNIIGAYRAAVEQNYDTVLSEVAVTNEKESIHTDDRYQKFYSLFPDA